MIVNLSIVLQTSIRFGSIFSVEYLAPYHSSVRLAFSSLALAFVRILNKKIKLYVLIKSPKKFKLKL